MIFNELLIERGLYCAKSQYLCVILIYWVYALFANYT